MPHLSGMRNLRLWWEAGGGRGPTPTSSGALAVAGLGDAIDRRVKTYSQGMRQRLGLARVLLGRPELLLLDEPTNGLDPREMRAVRQLVRRLSEPGSTVLFSSHLLSEIEQVCSHVVVMDKGQLVTTGTVEELLGTAGSAYFEVDDVEPPAGCSRRSRRCSGSTTRRRASRRRSTAVRAPRSSPRSSPPGVAVETVTARHQLEDAFLGLVEGIVMLTARRASRTELVKSSAGPARASRTGSSCSSRSSWRSRSSSTRPTRRRGASALPRVADRAVPPGFALRVTSAFLLVVVVALFAGDAVAGEASWGNLRYLLMRPGRPRPPGLREVRRRGVLRVARGRARRADRARRRARSCFGAEPIEFPFTLFIDGQSTGDILVPPRASPPCYVSWCLTGVVAFSFMVSCMTDAPFGAIFAGVGLYFTSLILDEITSLGNIRYGLPTHYFDAWVDLVTQRGVARRSLARRAAAARLHARLRPRGPVVVPAQGHPELTWPTGRPSPRSAPPPARLVLAVATFGATRSANRAAPRQPSARARPGSGRCSCRRRLEDPAEKIMWGDQHWTRLPGGRASVEVGDGSRLPADVIAERRVRAWRSSTGGGPYRAPVSPSRCNPSCCSIRNCSSTPISTSSGRRVATSTSHPATAASGRARSAPVTNATSVSGRRSPRRSLAAR